MSHHLTLTIAICLLLINHFLYAFDGSVGTGTCGFKDGVPKNQALIGKATSLFESTTGDLLFYDSYNFRIMKVSQQDGLISSIIGNGKQGYTEDHCQADKCGLTFVDGIIQVGENIFYFDRILTPTSSTRILRVVGSFGKVNTLWQVDYVFSTSASIFEKRTFGLSADQKYLFFNHDRSVWKMDLASMKTFELVYTEPYLKILTFTIYGSELIHSVSDQSFSHNHIDSALGFFSLPKSIYCTGCMFSSIQSYGNTFNFSFNMEYQPIMAGVAGQYLVLSKGPYTEQNQKYEFSNLDNGYFFILEECKITKSQHTSLDQGCTANCSHQGTCVGEICSCDEGWLGDAICSKYTCEKVDGCGLNGHCVGPNQCECKKGWSGPGCNDFGCSLMKNCNGHGKCIASNLCECQAGWQGSDDCSQFSCEKITCKNNGQCSGPNQCDCPPGYQGSPDCSIVSCEQVGNCNSHGSCIAPNTCKCRDGWSGTNCSQFSCVPSCKNGGVCTGPNQCKCPSGYRGSSDCSIPSYEDQGNCYLNGECIGPNTCQCDVGWLGSNCKDPDCQLSCNNRGKCSKPFECVCNDGWKGINCELVSCENVNNCNNRGSCVGPNTCQCNEGWKGVECDIPSCVRNCSNIGTCINANTCICPSYNIILHAMVWHQIIQKFAKEEEHVRGMMIAIMEDLLLVWSF